MTSDDEDNYLLEEDLCLGLFLFLEVDLEEVLRLAVEDFFLEVDLLDLLVDLLRTPVDLLFRTDLREAVDPLLLIFLLGVDLFDLEEDILDLDREDNRDFDDFFFVGLFLPEDLAVFPLVLEDEDGREEDFERPLPEVVCLLL